MSHVHPCVARSIRSRLLFGPLSVALLFAIALCTPGGSLSAQPVTTADLAVVAPIAPVMPGATATATVTVRGDLEVAGLSFGLIHDPSILTLASGDIAVGTGGVSLSAVLADTHLGAGPDFLSVDYFTNGFTFAAVINTQVSGPNLDANVVHEVASIDYSVSPTAQFGSTSIVFSDTLGTPPVALSVGMGLEFAEEVGVDLNVTNATVFITIPFLRGDVNQNGQVTISDAIYLLTQLFLSAPMTCRDAADADGTGVLSVNDAVFVLNFLFNEGPALPAPAPAGGCGVPVAPSDLGCEAFVCP